MKRNLVYLALCSLLLAACVGKEGQEFINLLKEEREAAVAKSLTILYSDSAVVRVRIKAPRLLTYEDGKEGARREFTEGVAVDFFDTQGEMTSHLTAKFATHYLISRKIILEDSVVVWNNEGEKLETEELIWHEASDSIYCNPETFVKISTPLDTLWGYGLRSNMSFTLWEIDRVTGTAQSNSLID